MAGKLKSANEIVSLDLSAVFFFQELVCVYCIGCRIDHPFLAAMLFRQYVALELRIVPDPDLYGSYRSGTTSGSVPELRVQPCIILGCYQLLRHVIPQRSSSASA